VIGLVLAAGAGKRLQPWTDSLPKTLIPIDGDRSILDVALANFKQVGLEHAAIVVGYAAERVSERLAELERRHGLGLELIFNPKAEEWNNAYSLWCARDTFAGGALLANGDTVHPASVQETLLEAHAMPDAQELLIAVDQVKPLGEEEMKVHVSEAGLLERINKAIDPAGAHGEYIGLTLIAPAAAQLLAEALEATWQQDPSLYYEDGFQEYADRGGHIGIAPIGDVEWVEVDDHADLERAREVACRC
jgi:choline kinase